MIEHATTGAEKDRSYNGDYMDIGRRGEEVVIGFLKERPCILGITDYREVREVHEADVDIGLRLYTGQVLLAEIKTDTYLGVTGNIISEVLRINYHSPHAYAGYLGWTLRSPAKILLYYAPNHKEGPVIYKITFQKMREVLQRYIKNNPKASLMRVLTDTQKTTFNILIPETEYEGLFTKYPLNGG